MVDSTILAATWADGLFVVKDGEISREHLGKSVRGLAADGSDGAIAVVDTHQLCQRSAHGEWTTLLRTELELSCALVVDDTILVGTDDARIFAVVGNELDQIDGFDSIQGRDSWFAGTAVIDGKEVGPPLGVRSMSCTADGALLANIHVGGIPRTDDGGNTWRPTIDVDFDVHEVRAHPTNPNLVAAAAAVGLCVSEDGGVTWRLIDEGLHSPYCAAVAFVGEQVYVSCAEHHFARDCAIYKLSADRQGPLEEAKSGLPAYVDGVVDTGCITTRGSEAALVDRDGTLYVTNDSGASWSPHTVGIRDSSGLLLV